MSMLNPSEVIGICPYTRKARIYVRCTGAVERSGARRQRRAWPALLAHVERLRGLGPREHEWTTHSLRDGLACKRLANEVWPAE